MIFNENPRFRAIFWAPVQDFSKNTLFLERCLSVFAIFACFSVFDHVLGHYLWCFGISLMIFWRFFDFWTIFDDFGGSDPDFDTVLTRSKSVIGIFAIQIWALSDSFLMHFWSVLGMWLGFFASNFRDFSLKFKISSTFLKSNLILFWTVLPIQLVTLPE